MSESKERPRSTSTAAPSELDRLLNSVTSPRKATEGGFYGGCIDPPRGPHAGRLRAAAGGSGQRMETRGSGPARARRVCDDDVRPVDVQRQPRQRKGTCLLYTS